MELPDSPYSPVSSLSRHCCRQVSSPSQSRSSLWGWIWQAPKNCQLHRIRHRLKSRRIGMLCSGTCRARVEWNPVRGCISLRSSGLDLLPGFRFTDREVHNFQRATTMYTNIHPSILPTSTQRISCSRYVQEQRVNNSPSLQQESMLVLFRNLSFPVKFKDLDSEHRCLL